MQIKCDYCDTLNNETNKYCRNCGAPLPGNHRTSDSQPHTIEELKQWYKDMNLPPEEVTRFFIGKDIKEAKAFGIYKNNIGDFVVYKNKADGSRAIRYEGADEAYAVNELYQRLKEEIANQKSRNNREQTKRERLAVISIGSVVFATLYLIAVLFMMGYTSRNNPSAGYYRYNNNDYYYTGHQWYTYDDDTDNWWRDYDIKGTITNENDDYYRIDADSHIGQEFSYWSSNNRAFDSDSWDSGWSSGDSWNSSGTNWSSDW